MADLNSQAIEEIESGDFESILQDASTSDTADESVEREQALPPASTDTGLAKYLKSTIRGKEILKDYVKNDNVLPKNTRSKLTRLVIHREKEWLLRNITPHQQLDKFKISSQRFILLANEITKIFENEHSITYYKPFQVENGKRNPASGKLLDNFNYEKECLRNIGLVTRKLNKSSDSNYTHIISTEVLYELDWLKANVDNWDMVKLCWEDTFDTRRHQLTVEKVSTADFIDNYLCLQIQKGLELIKWDFEKLYPQLNGINQSEWKEIKTCILVQLKGLKNIFTEDLGLIQALSANVFNEEQEDFIIFHLLPYLITGQRPRKRSKKSAVAETNQNIERPLKLSLQERRETFILEVKSSSDVEHQVQVLQKKLKENKQSFQPLIVAVGSTTNIVEYFVVINDQFYKQQSCWEAVTLALKIFFVFDCSYPQSSLTLWLFVQTCIFNINLTIDANNVSLSVLRGHIAHKLKEKNYQ